MIAQINTIIFDWDLTLWNSWDTHLWLLDRTADALEVPRPQQADVARSYSTPFLEHLAWFFPRDQKRAVDTYLAFYHQIVSSMPDLYPGVLQAIRQLKNQGYRVGIFSDKRHAFGAPELQQTEIAALVDHSLFLLDGRPYKPDPQGLHQVLNALGVEASRALYVGDTGDDMECARRAGVSSGAALWGSLDRGKLVATKPDFQWDRPDEIVASLSGS
ncbi:MAG: hypothetical protein BZY88_00115 [SAR202 cluster bacterium Io17-Chloro-G9]|nr:MAG: hypothetical protein BZY88_00115 [SAR202 cluster bacterium Io17-Chloro-G9]